MSRRSACTCGALPAYGNFFNLPPTKSIHLSQVFAGVSRLVAGKSFNLLIMKMKSGAKNTYTNILMDEGQLSASAVTAVTLISAGYCIKTKERNGDFLV